MTPTPPAPRNMRTFLVIWFGQLISLLGSGLTNFALGVWLYERTGQATPWALAALFATVPRLALSPLAGVLADRLNRRRLMIAADSADALITLCAALLLWTGQLEVWHVYLIALTSSLAGAFQEPAYTASITMLVPKKDLGRASGLGSLSNALELLLAPGLAGVLFVLIGLDGIIFIDFLTYFFAVGTLLLVRIPQPAPEPAEAGATRRSALAEMAFGWRYLRARAGLLGLLLYFALVNFLLNVTSILTGPLVLSVSSAAGLGAVEVASGVGLLAGSLLMSAWGGPRRRIAGVVGFIFLASLAYPIMALRPVPLMPAIGRLLMMACLPLASGASQAIFQTKVAPAVQGRVFAMRGLVSRSMMPLAFISAGPLADLVFEPAMRPGGWLAGAWPALVLGTGPGRGIAFMMAAGGLLLIATSAAVWANPRIRNVETDLPDALAEPAPEPVIEQAAEAEPASPPAEPNQPAAPASA